MPRPQNKQELYEVIQKERTILNKALENLSEEHKLQPGACGEWSVKDILAHLIDWEQRGLRWYRAGLQGEVPKTPDDAYNWRELPALNQAIYETYRDWPLQKIEEAYQKSYQETMAALDQMTEAELFSANYYPWTGNGLLRDYVNANTASHLRSALRVSLGQQVDPIIRQTHQSGCGVKSPFQQTHRLGE